MAKSLIPKPEAAVIIILWLILSTLMFLFFQGRLQSFYFLAAWPLPLVFLAWFAANLKEFFPKHFTALMVFFLAAQAIQLAYFYPAAYNPDLRHGNLVAMFSFVKAQADGKTFNVINGFADPNLFHYYMTFTNTAGEITKSRAEALFVICEKSNNKDCDVGQNTYQKSREFTYGNFNIYGYQPR